MGTTANVLTGLGTDRLVYKQVGDDIGIVVGPRTSPRIITPGLDGYKLGLYDPEFVNQTVVPYGGAATYFVRIVPEYDGLIDTAGDNLTGIPTAENTTKGVSFSFLPVAEEYPCTGYQVWAGTVSGTLYLQGTLSGRYATDFTIGTTWAYASTGATLSAKTDQVPQFVSAAEAFQAEGAVATRTFLGGGKKYDTGYAKVAQAAAAAALSGGTSAESDYTQWTGITDGAFRMKLGWERYEADGVAQKAFLTIRDLDFSGDTSMANIATTIQTALRGTISPALFSGTAIDTTIANWTSITDGSFEVYIRGTQYQVTGLDFSSDTTMANIASTIQAGLRSATGGSVETVTWDATAGRMIVDPNIPAFSDIITNGDFSSATGWTEYETGNATIAIGSGVCTWSKTSGATGDASERQSGTATAGKIYDLSIYYDKTGMVDDSGVLIQLGFSNDDETPETGAFAEWTLATLDSTGTLTATIAAPAGSPSPIIRAYATGTFSNGDLVFDNFACIERGAALTLSYLYRHSGGTGTDISAKLDARDSSLTAVLDSLGKQATTETVTWSTDHFVITSPNTGDQYRIGFLEAPPVGTDISTSTYMDCRSTGNGTVTWGQTALRTVLGNGTTWGEWAGGVNFRLKSESFRTLVGYQLEGDVLHLDANYVGDAFNGWQAYVLEPFDQQVYISDLKDPFTYATANILELPITSDDGITAIRKVGLNIAIFMQHHVWMLSSVDITAPRLISDQFGATNDAAVVTIPNGVVFFTGEDFMILVGGRLRSIDPEGRIRELISRFSDKTLEPHGVYFPDERGDVVKWWVGIDNSTLYNVAICWDVKRGNWWLENHKDAYCSTTIRDANDKAHVITGTSYDSANSIPSFTMLHGDDYKNDGASAVSGATKHGLINSVGSDTETAGYLTCGTSGTAGTFTSVDDGYFRVAIDGTTYDVGPCDFTGDSTLSDVASTIQTAIRAKTGGSETCTHNGTAFVITSGTTTNQSHVDYLAPYLPTTDDTDLSSVTYMNGREGQATKTWAVSTSVLNLYSETSGADAALYTDNDGEKGCFIVVCDTSLNNLQLARVVSNTATQVTVTPALSTAPSAGWYWYMGGIVPSWTKWMDFNSSQHKQKVHGIAVTVAPGEDAEMNYLGIHGMQDLSSTVRTTEVQAIGGTAATVNTRHLKDKEATQHGIKVLRPGSSHDLKIEDITVAHAPRV